MTQTSPASLTVRLKNPTKTSLLDLSKITDRSMSYHTEKALEEYIEREKQRVELLRESLELGISELNAGKGVRMTSTSFEAVKKRGQKRLEASKTKEI